MVLASSRRRKLHLVSDDPTALTDATALLDLNIATWEDSFVLEQVDAGLLDRAGDPAAAARAMHDAQGIVVEGAQVTPAVAWDQERVRFFRGASWTRR
jgi:hypothetical protein